MANTFMQPSFAGGEIGPALWGRVDLQQYMSSLKLCRNWIVQPYGGLKNRAGTRFVAETKISAKASRLVSFAFSTEQTYMLELGDYYARVFTYGGQVIIQAAVSAYAAGTTYARGAYASAGGVNYQSLADSNIGNAPAASPTWWYPLTADIVEFPTPWASTEIDKLKFTQSADVLTVCHPTLGPYNVTRTAHDVWTVDKIEFYGGPFEDTNKDTTITMYASAVSGSVVIAANSAIFKSTDVGRLVYMKMQDDGQPWTPGQTVTLNTIRRAYGKYYISTTAASTACGVYAPENDSDIWNDGAVTWQFLHPGFGIAKITALDTAPAYVAATAYGLGAIVADGGVRYVSIQAANTGHTPASSPTWWTVKPAGTIVTAMVVSRIPDPHIISTTPTYKWALGAWCEENGYPTCVTYHQQRQAYGNTAADPQTVWLSTTDDFSNFGKHSPIQDNDVLIYPLAGRQVNAIRHLLTIGANLLAFTSGSVWSIAAPNEGALTQTDVVSKPQGYDGCSDLEPIAVGNQAIFVEDKGQKVRNVSYDYASNSFTGEDLSEMIPHLLEGHALVDWAYQRTPFSCIWCVREDGVLLSLTYNKQQKVAAWAQHTTEDGDSLIMSVGTVSEGSEDYLYLIVARYVDGAWRQYVERMESRLVSDRNAALFMDSALTYNGINATLDTLTVSGGTLWAPSETLQIEASANKFALTDITDAIVLLASDGTRVVLTITGYTSPTIVSAVSNRSMPVELRNAAWVNWAFARNVFTGLGHLEGKTLAVTAEGLVQPQATVVSGAITLPRPAYYVNAGIPYNSDFITLDLAVASGEVIREKRKSIARVFFQLDNTLGLSAGPTEDKLRPMKLRRAEPYDDPITPFTGLHDLLVDAQWGTSGSLFVRQADPCPASVVAILPDVIIGPA